MDERDIFAFSLSLADRDKIAIAVATVAFATLLLPPYLAVYYRWLRDEIKYPDANLFSSSDVTDEKQTKGHLRFLFAEKVHRRLDILSPRLSASIFDERSAKVLQNQLNKRPNLIVRMLIGSEIEGFDGSNHPFYSAFRRNSNQVQQVTYDGEFPFAGIQADDYLLMQTSLSGGELVPSVPYYQDYGVGDNHYMSTQVKNFSSMFNKMWSQADRQRPPRIVPLAA